MKRKEYKLTLTTAGSNYDYGRDWALCTDRLTKYFKLSGNPYKIVAVFTDWKIPNSYKLTIDGTGIRVDDYWFEDSYRWLDKRIKEFPEGKCYLRIEYDV